MKTAARAAAVLLAACLSIAAVRADRGGYVIRSFHTNLVVRADADLLVEERIAVEFKEARRGIYRTIPVRYTDPRGFTYSLGFTLVEVVDGSGRAHTVKTSWEGRYVKLRIGDADRTVRGPVDYVIRYRVRGAVCHFADHDELYWNATGNEWQARIERASAAVLLPGPVADASLESAGYTGRFGSRAQDVRIERTGPETVGFVATRPLEPLEGLTVVAAWPHGLVSFPGPWRRFGRLLVDNLVLIVPPLALFGLVALYRRHGRDPKGRGSVVVRYEPPPGVTPAELGSVVDETVHLRDITATVVDLAVRGHLRIHIEEESAFLGLKQKEVTVFERLPSPPEDDLLRHEKLLLDGLFESGRRVRQEDLENEFYKKLPGIRRAVYERLTAERYFALNPSTIRTIVAVGAPVAALLTFLAGVLYASLRGGIMPQALFVPVAAAVLTGVIVLAFSRAMPRKTKKGVQLAEWARGFEEFVERVEAERLEQGRARDVFERLLPYAMALGVASAWARRFEGIYAQSGAAAPAWFVGQDSAAGFSTMGFQKSLDAAMSRAGDGMTTAPRSSGSSGAGGGGFSGGGGGGGGGGSW